MKLWARHSHGRLSRREGEPRENMRAVRQVRPEIREAVGADQWWTHDRRRTRLPPPHHWTSRSEWIRRAGEKDTGLGPDWRRFTVSTNAPAQPAICPLSDRAG